MTVFQDEEEAVVQVIDDGPGVPDETLPMLFGRYLHGRGGALVRGSVGLGTAVVNAYTEELGGTVDYRRKDDRTIFEVRLPAVVSESADKPAASLVWLRGRCRSCLTHPIATPAVQWTAIAWRIDTRE